MNASKSVFLERSIGEAARFFNDVVFSEEVALKKGFLQAVDARWKIIGLAGLIVWTSLARSLWAITSLYAASLVLALVSGMRIGHFLRRVWVFVPLFGIVILVPALFWYGPVVACTLVMRIATSVSFAALLVLTTKRTKLFASLASLGIPRIFVQILGMMYTYVFLLMKSFEEMHLALAARLVRRMPGNESRRWVASRISALYVKSYRMSQEVFQAMLARGYDGRAKAMKRRDGG